MLENSILFWPFLFFLDVFESQQWLLLNLRVCVCCASLDGQLWQWPTHSTYQLANSLSHGYLPAITVIRLPGQKTLMVDVYSWAGQHAVMAVAEILKPLFFCDKISRIKSRQAYLLHYYTTNCFKALSQRARAWPSSKIYWHEAVASKFFPTGRKKSLNSQHSHFKALYK